MVKNFILTRPRYDTHTSYLHDFSKGIIKVAKAIPGVHVVNLEGPKANRKELEAALGSGVLVFLNGHGSRKTVRGHKNEIILDNKNIKLTKNSIVYTISCDSLEDLGQIAIKNGTTAYIGYKARFMMIIDPSRTTSPNKDKNALPFRRACYTLIASLISGLTVEKAIKLTKKEYLHSIKSYGTSEDDPYGDTPLIRFALAWNYEFLDMAGDPTASF